jgi:hypothetical protein
MLIAVAITLVMMAAVVTLFANITDSVRNRRATIEMSAQLRHVRNMLQQDLQAATCPGVTWQRPESNHGYIEIIEGIFRDSFPSMLTDGDDDSDNNGNPDIDGDTIPDVDELDAKASFVPRNNNVTDTNGNGRIDDEELAAHLQSQASLAFLNGLGDYDDVLMFTARNEHEPYVGRVPDLTTAFKSIKSPLAEIIWFAIENPSQAENNVGQGFFGEPGMRTIYRRALLIAPWFDPIGDLTPADPTDDMPGVVAILPDLTKEEAAKALAALIHFQDQYDLSVRLEWDPLANSAMGQWKIIANTLFDLSKRENRFGHYGFNSLTFVRSYPYAALSTGIYSGTPLVRFVPNPQPGLDQDGNAMATPNMNSGQVLSYTVRSPLRDAYQARPFVYVEGRAVASATANAMVDDEGRVIRVLHGPVPLWGPRRGQDVMLSNVLAFDLRVYDPGAPIYMESTTQTMLEPSDPGWKTAFAMPSTSVPLVNLGSYVDMGYAFLASPTATPVYPAGMTVVPASFAQARGIYSVLNPNTVLTPGYTMYDTWSLSYENNTLDEDNRDGDNNLMTGADEATNGLDDFAIYPPLTTPQKLLGPDDVGERETAPPYDVPLRGVQVILRVYEGDSRQIRQVRVNQHFLAE